MAQQKNITVPKMDEKTQNVIFKLPNGKPIDEDMIMQGMQDSNLMNYYFLNTQTGEVEIFLDGDERIETIDEMDIETYIPIERLASYEQYQWMEDFISDLVEPEDKQAAEKLSIAIQGKGAFRRFKDVLHKIDNGWLEAWYQWEEDSLYEAMKEWFTTLPIKITEEFDDCKVCDHMKSELNC